MGKIILTDDRPTGRFHVRHYVGSLKHKVELQGSGEFDEIYIMITDTQALTDSADNPEKMRQDIIEVALNYLACGLDPSKSVLFIQSQIPELCEMTFYYMGLVTISRLQHNPTVRSKIQVRSFEAGTPVGLFTYPISQAAGITAFRTTTVPMGKGQAPVIEQTKEIVYKFNTVRGGNLMEPDILLPDSKTCLRLPGTDGKVKMSKSLDSCVYLVDSEASVKRKIMSMFTDPSHLHVEDPGQVEGNPVFVYPDTFCHDEHFAEYLPDYKNLDELKAHYMRDGPGNIRIKKFLNNVLQDELRPIREHRKEFAGDIPVIYRVLEEKSRKAQAKMVEALVEMKRAMRINYFEDKDLIAEQALRFQSEE